MACSGEVGQRALPAAGRLVEHDAGVRQHHPAARRTAGEQHGGADDAAWPTQVVPTGGRMNCIVS